MHALHSRQTITKCLQPRLTIHGNLNNHILERIYDPDPDNKCWVCINRIYHIVVVIVWFSNIAACGSASPLRSPHFPVLAWPSLV